MKKNYLKSFCARFLTLLVLALMSTNLAWGEKITTLAGITSGNNYYIGATTSSTDYYLYVDGSATTASIAGTAKAAKSDAVALTFTAVEGGWTIQFGNGNYLGLKNGKDNGKVQVLDAAAIWTIEEVTDKSLLKLSTNGYCLQKNNSGAQFGSYGNTQTNVWLEAAGTSTSATLESIVVSGNPDKTNYKSNEAFDPTGLTVTGYYDDETNAPITSGIEWTVDPSGNLPVGTTSVSVIAKVGDIESASFEVTGLTVTEFVQTFANTYTSNVELTTEGGTSAYTAEVIIDGTNYDAIKCGTGSVKGACVITIPANTKTLHFHVAGWNGETMTLGVNGTEYTLNADAGVNGNSPFTLRNDPEEKDYFTLDPNGATTITFTASQTTTGKRFVLFGVNAEPLKTQKVTITAAKYATLGLPYAVTIPEDVSAYTATVEGTTVTMTKISGGVIPANCGVILYAEAGDYTFTETTPPNLAVTNKLVAALEDYTCTGEDVGKVYYLGKDGEKATFKKLNENGTIAAGKAYLKLDEALSEGAKLDVTFDEPTGIKTIDNGQLTIDNSKAYNLNGVRVNPSTGSGQAYKGIIIVNGKKYINK